VADLQVGHPGANLTRLPSLLHRVHVLAGEALRKKPGGEMHINVGDNNRDHMGATPAGVWQGLARDKPPQPRQLLADASQALDFLVRFMPLTRRTIQPSWAVTAQ
jgi:hypothetical protein